MEDRSGGDPSVSGFGTDGFETIFQSANERSTRWSGVAGIHNPRRFIEVDFCGFDEVFNRLDESRGVGSVGESGSVTLPSVLQHLSAWINELDTIILLLVLLNAPAVVDCQK